MTVYETRVGALEFTYDFVDGYFRLYSPTQAFLDKSWILPDIEKATT